MELGQPWIDLLDPEPVYPCVLQLGTHVFEDDLGMLLGERMPLDDPPLDVSGRIRCDAELAGGLLLARHLATLFDWIDAVPAFDGPSACDVSRLRRSQLPELSDLGPPGRLMRQTVLIDEDDDAIWGAIGAETAHLVVPVEVLLVRG